MLANLPRPLAPPSIRARRVIHFLRGSLNFGMRRALARAYGFNVHCSSFITSQRERDAYGRWFIKDNQYRKIAIPPHATLFFADVIATGVTISNGLEIIVQLAKNSGAPIRQIVFFTIGCHKLEKLLREYSRRLKEIFPGYERTVAVYLEGKFHLADSKTAVRIKLQGTDLMRHPAILAPEFELAQYERLSSALERCVVYDAGTRAFDADDYLRSSSVLEEVAVRRGGLDAGSAPGSGGRGEYRCRTTGSGRRRRARRGVGDAFLRRLHGRLQGPLDERVRARAGDAEGARRALLPPPQRDRPSPLSSASRISSTGASTPSQTRSCSAACQSSISVPGIATAPAARASARRRVSIGL